MRRVNKSRWYQQKMLSKTFNKEWSTYIQNNLTNDLEDLKINLLLAKPDLISKLTSVTKRSKWYLGYGFLRRTFIVQASLKQNLHKAGTSSLDQTKLAFANFHESTYCVKRLHQRYLTGSLISLCMKKKFRTLFRVNLLNIYG